MLIMMRDSTGKARIVGPTCETGFTGLKGEAGGTCVTGLTGYRETRSTGIKTSMYDGFVLLVDV